jgi:hypothetical protein
VVAGGVENVLPLEDAALLEKAKPITPDGYDLVRNVRPDASRKQRKNKIIRKASCWPDF